MSALRIVFIIWLLTCRFFAHSQDENSTLLLDGVTIYGSRLKDVEIGLKTLTIDSLILTESTGNSISELIRKVGAGNIRSYGPSGLSTPSFRGTSGSQTAMVWNGITINSPLNGTLDLSQLPVTAIDAVDIQKGGSSSLYGSGAIGGTIQLNNHLTFSKGFSFALENEVGSFGHQFLSRSFKASNAKTSWGINFYNRVVENDFPFRNKYTRPPTDEIRENAAYEQMGILQHLDFKLSKQHLVGFKVWLQRNRYEVPNPIIGGDGARAVQSDREMRSLLQWNYNVGSTVFTYKQAFMRHSLSFEDPTAQIDSESISSVWVNRIEGAWYRKEGWQFISGINYRYEFTGAENFGAEQSRNNIAFFNSIKYTSQSDGLSSALTVRQELIDGQIVPIAPTLGLEYAWSSRWLLKGNISRNYRIPTFNDLYWNGSGGFGNPNLLPEQSWGGDFGVQLTAFKRQKSLISMDFNLFSQSVDNWILWRPIRASEWSPDNIKRVWTRGSEFALSGSFERNKWGYEFNLTHQYTKTTNEEVTTELFEREKGKQLIYTPQNETSFSNTFRYQRISLTLRHNYVGKQYTEGENKDVFALSDYHLLETIISYIQDLNKLKFKCYLELNNMLDTQYENRRGFPMYGRNYSLGLQLFFN